jgi:hypothetical protein
MCLLKTIISLKFILTIIFFTYYVVILNFHVTSLSLGFWNGLDFIVFLVRIYCLRAVLLFSKCNRRRLCHLINARTLDQYVFFVNLLIFTFIHFSFLLWFLNYF